MKEMFNASLIIEQNKLFKNQVMQMHKQISQKDQEIERL